MSNDKFKYPTNDKNSDPGLAYAFWREIFEEPEKLEKVLPKSELGTGRKAGILDIWISVTT